MSKANPGFIIDIKRPTRDGFVACLVVTPKRRDNSANVVAKIERNLRREKAVQISYELLLACGATEELLAEVRALAPSLNEPIIA